MAVLGQVGDAGVSSRRTGWRRSTALAVRAGPRRRRAGRSRTGPGRPRCGRRRRARRSPTISPARTEKPTSRKTPARVRPSTSSRTSPIGVSTFGNSDTARPTMCRTRSAVVRLARRRRDDVPAVAEDRRPVAQVEDLVEPVADEQDRHAAIAEPADDREQPLDLVGGERRRRLVEDQDARLDRQRLGDLDELLVGHRQAADRRADVEAGRRARRTAPAPPGASRPSRSCPSRPDGAWPMNTFSATVRSGKRRGSWWTTAIPSARAWAGPWIWVASPSSQIVPLSGWWTPARILTSVLLPAPFSPTSAWTSPGSEVEGDVVEGLGRGEPLGDPAQLGARRRRGRRRSPLGGHRAGLAASEPSVGGVGDRAAIGGDEPDVDAARGRAPRPSRPGAAVVRQDDARSGRSGRTSRTPRAPTSCGRRSR